MNITNNDLQIIKIDFFKELFKNFKKNSKKEF